MVKDYDHERSSLIVLILACMGQGERQWGQRILKNLFLQARESCLLVWRTRSFWIPLPQCWQCWQVYQTIVHSCRLRLKCPFSSFQTIVVAGQFPLRLYYFCEVTFPHDLIGFAISFTTKLSMSGTTVATLWLIYFINCISFTTIPSCWAEGHGLMSRRAQLVVVQPWATTDADIGIYVQAKPISICVV